MSDDVTGDLDDDELVGIVDGDDQLDGVLVETQLVGVLDGDQLDGVLAEAQLVGTLDFRTVEVEGPGGGGGSAHLEWGPDFGEGSGSDGITFEAAAETELVALDLAATVSADADTRLTGVEVGVVLPETTAAVDLEAVDLGGTVPATADVVLSALDLAATLAPATAEVDLVAVDLGAELPETSVAVDLESVELGAEATATATATLASVDVAATLPEAAASTSVGAVEVGAVHPVSVSLSASVLSAPFWQDVRTGSSSSSVGTSFTLPVPPGVEAGDLLVALIDTNATAPPTTTIVAGGFTFVGSYTGGNLQTVCWFKVATGTEPSSYTVNLGVPSLNATGELHHIVGQRSTNPIDASDFAFTPSTALDPDPPPPDLFVPTNNSLVFAHLAHDHLTFAQTHGVPSGHREVTDFESVTASGRLGSTTAWRVFQSGTRSATDHNCSQSVGTDALTTRWAIAPGPFDIS